VVIGDMGELPAAAVRPGAIPDGVDAPVAGAKVLVHRDAALVMGDAGRLELEPVGHGAPAGGDDEVARFQLRAGAPVLDDEADVAILASDLADGGVLADGDAVAAQGGKDMGCKLGILPAEGAPGLDHGYRRAEAPVRLRQLEADGAAADDDEMLGPPRQVEGRLVGEEGHRVEA